MAIIGSAYVEIHALDKFLQRDIDNAIKKIKDPSLNFTADIDLKPIRAQIKALRNEVKSAPIKFTIESNYQELIDNLDMIKEDQIQDPLVLNVDTDVIDLEAKLEELKNKYASIPAQIGADADTAVAEAQLGFAARNRRSVISMDIDPKTKAAFSGLFYTLIGALPANQVRAAFQSIASNFQTLAIAATKLATVVGTVGSVALTAGANLITVADDIGAVIGITAMAPAALSAVAAGLATNVIAWKGFGEAVTGEGKKGAEALAKLPPEARKAAVAMRGLGASISKPVQSAFWKEMQDSLQKTTDVFVPKLTKGLSNTGTIMGRITSSVLASFREMAESGGLDTLFKNLNKGWENAAKGAKPLFDALNTLSVSGSKFLAPFGESLGNLGIRFNNFIQEAEKAGRIDDWINEAVNSFNNLGSVVGSTVSIFKGLSEASAMSGSASLDDFADGMRNIAEVVNGEPFRSRLVTVLEGARSGTDALGDGFKTLNTLIGKSSETISEFLETTGQISGSVLSNISAMFDGTGLGTGMLTALWGMQDAVRMLEPGFRDLGIIIGDLGEISGTVFTSMAPGLNNLLSTLSGIVAGLKDGVIAAMPVFNEFFQGLLTAASGPLITLAQGVGNLLTLFSQLPGPIQIALTSLGLLVAFRGKITGLFTGIASAFTTMQTGIAGQATGLSKSMQNMYKHFGNAGSNIGSAANAMRLIPFAATTSGLGGVAAAAGAATASVGKAAGSGLRGALSGGAALLGGPWGIALAAGVGLIAAFGQAQADSDARVKSLSQSLDQQTGKVTNATKTLVATNVLDGATNGWDDFFRGVVQGSQSVEEALGNLGISTQDFTDKIADPSGRDAYIRGLETISDAMRDGRPITEEMAAAIGTTSEKLKDVNGNTMRRLADEAKGAASELTRAEIATKAIADATGTTSAQAAILSRNYETLANAASSASEKFSALKQNLDILSGGSMSFAESQKGVQQSLDDTQTKLKEIAADSGGSLKSLYSVKDGFDFASQAGRNLHTALSGTADSILQIGTAALDQALKGGKSAADANSIAIQSMQPAIASLRSQLAATGMLPAQIDSIVRSFGLMPDQVTAAISVEGAEEAQRKIILTKLAADSFSNGNYAGVLSALPESAKAAIAEATGTAEAFKNGDWQTVLTALDQTGPGKEAALAQILSVTNGNYEAALKAIDITAPAVTAAKGSAASFAQGEYTAQLDGVSKVSPAAAEAASIANTFKNGSYVAQLNATNQAGKPAADATAVANAFERGDYTAMLKAMNITAAPVGAATGAARKFSLTDFTAALKAADSTAGGRAAAASAIRSTTGANYTAWIKALADQGSINGVRGQLAALTATRTMYINAVLNRATMPDLNGSASGSGRPGLANGGLFRTVSNQRDLFQGQFKAKMFANGGIEKHIAQIAKGGPIRMWAEPETGGEAYIPLSRNKRKRSLEILRKVMAEFGLGEFAKFADGGIIPKYNVSNIYSSAASSAPPVYSMPAGNSGATAAPIIVNIYPREGMDEVEIGKAAVKELNWQIQSR